MNVRNWLICNRRFRRLMLWISRYVLRDQISELLYPDDLIITFGEGPE